MADPFQDVEAPHHDWPVRQLMFSSADELFIFAQMDAVVTNRNYC